MQTTALIEMQAEMAYRTNDIAEQFRRAGARERRGAIGPRSHLRWRTHRIHRNPAS